MGKSITGEPTRIYQVANQLKLDMQIMADVCSELRINTNALTTISDKDVRRIQSFIKKHKPKLKSPVKRDTSSSDQIRNVIQSELDRRRWNALSYIRTCPSTTSHRLLSSAI